MNRILLAVLVIGIEFFLLIFVGLFLFSRGDNHAEKVVECDFYSVDAIYYSPGSAQEVKRKACEYKYYGFSDEGAKLFNLGELSFKVKGYMGFVLHSPVELKDPKKFRGAADLYIIMPLMSGERVMGVGGLPLTIRYGSGEYFFNDGSDFGRALFDRVYDSDGFKVYSKEKSHGWDAFLYIMNIGDNRLVLRCTRKRKNDAPDECFALREYAPHVQIEYKVNWSDVSDWKKFDSKVVSFVDGLRAP